MGGQFSPSPKMADQIQIQRESGGRSVFAQKKIGQTAETLPPKRFLPIL